MDYFDEKDRFVATGELPPMQRIALFPNTGEIITAIRARRAEVIERHRGPNEDIEVEGVVLYVEYSHDPAEPDVGLAESLVIERVLCGGVDITPLLVAIDPELTVIEKALRKYIGGRDCE